MAQPTAATTATTAPIPLRNGVSASCVVLPSSRQPLWPTVLDALEVRLPGVERSEWQRRLAAGDVLDAQGQPLRADSPCHSGMRLYYWRHVHDEPEVPFAHAVLFQDAHLVVADKPHGLPVVPGGRYVQHTLLARLKRELDLPTLTPLHRIDRETAGLVVFAVQPATRGRYHALFAERAVEKEYEAVAPFRVELALPRTYRSRLVDAANFMQMSTEVGEPNAETRIELLEQAGALARYQLSPLTGRRHQLRMHCAALGMPILHDRIYPELLPENTDDYARPLQLLARRIAFRDPVTGAERCFESQRRLMSLVEACL